jgi:hypothetical protein
MRCSFLFDIFLGHSYNQLPPSVKYMTVIIRLSGRLLRPHKIFVDQWGQVSVQPQLICGIFLLALLRKISKTFLSRTERFAYRSWERGQGRAG